MRVAHPGSVAVSPIEYSTPFRDAEADFWFAFGDSAVKEHLVIFDTTLRDGEQSPGASMTKDEKLRVARQLERMRVDVIEAGFAAASPGDFEAIKSIAEAIKDSTICSLARANESDIRKAGEAIRPAARGRIHTFIATSPIHMEKKLRMSPDQVLEAAVKAVRVVGAVVLLRAVDSRQATQTTIGERFER